MAPTLEARRQRRQRVVLHRCGQPCGRSVSISRAGVDNRWTSRNTPGESEHHCLRSALAATLKSCPPVVEEKEMR
jgi:hypothetical protein